MPGPADDLTVVARGAAPARARPGAYREAADHATAEERRPRRDLEFVRETARLLVEEPDARRLAELVARRACQLTDAERAIAVWLEADEPAVVGCWPPHAVADGARPQLDDPRAISARAVRHHRSWFDDEDGALQASFAVPHPPCGVAAIAILNHQHLAVGFVELHLQGRGSALDEGRRAALDTLAWQASVAFERGRNLDRMLEWSHSLSTLLTSTSIISQHASPTVILRRLVENASAILGAHGGMAGLALPAADRDDLVMTSDAYWHDGRWREHDQCWPLGAGIAGTVLQSEFPYITNEYRDDRLADRALASRFDIGRALCAPIKTVDGRMVGFFELHKREDDTEFTWQDVTFLESLASTAAITIENVRLVKMLEDKSEQIRALSARHMARLEEERQHIARELHDEAGQALIGIKLKLQALAHELPAGLEDFRLRIDRVRDEVNQSTSLLRTLARRLRPPILDHFGLDIALRQLALEYQEHTGISVLLECPADTPRLSCELALFRIAQEAMTNAAKHAAPTTVRLRLDAAPHETVLVVSDDGVGFDPEVHTSGLGLLGLRERVAQLGGELVIASSAGEGTHITARIPN